MSGTSSTRSTLTPRPRRGRLRAPSASACTSAGVPSAIFWPKLSTAMRSVTAITSSMWCSISSTVTPLSRTLTDALVELLDLLRVHAGGRLVEQQQLGLGGERAGKLEAALLAEGQVGGELVALVRRGRRTPACAPMRSRSALQPPSQRGSTALRVPLAVAGSPPPTGSARPRAGRTGGCSGRCARCRAATSAWLGSPVTSAPSKTMRPEVGRIEAGDQVDDGALARAVGADQAEDLALLDAQADTVDGLHAAEMLARGRRAQAPKAPAIGERRRALAHRAVRRQQPAQAPPVAVAQRAQRWCGHRAARRAQVHGEHDQRAEQQVAPVAQEAQALDQEALDEDHGDQRAEHAGKAAEDRIGDGEGGDAGC